MKPEAGQWWQMKDDAETRCFIVGECRNGNYIIEWKDGEYSEDNMEDWEHIPDCEDFDWKEPETVNYELKEQVAAFIANYYGDQCDEYEQDCIVCSKWKAFRELFELPEPPKPKAEPQPSEDPDEWVIQDKVPPRARVDQWKWVFHDERANDVAWSSTQGSFTRYKHGDEAGSVTLHVRCRRRDLPHKRRVMCKSCNRPKGEQKKTTDDFGMYLESVIAKDPQLKAEVDAAEAELAAIDARLNEPQPQKTRVRLWISAVDGAVYFTDAPKLRTDCEIFVDSEGFYVENQP